MDVAAEDLVVINVMLLDPFIRMKKLKALQWYVDIVRISSS